MRSDPADPLPPLAALPGHEYEGDGGRQRRGRRVLWVFVPLILVMVVTGALLLSLHAFSVVARAHAARGDLVGAQAAYARMAGLTGRGPAPWVAEYNVGTVLIGQEQPKVGLPWLERAYEKVPKAIPTADGKIESYSYECQVRANLAFGWESLGDHYYDQKRLPEAIKTYSVAVDWSRPCEVVEGERGEPDEKVDGDPLGRETPFSRPEDTGANTTERIEQKRAAAERELAGGEPRGSAGDMPTEKEIGGAEDSGAGWQPGQSFPGETEQEKARREELQEKNLRQMEAEREREESQNRYWGPRGW